MLVGERLRNPHHAGFGQVDDLLEHSIERAPQIVLMVGKLEGA